VEFASLPGHALQRALDPGVEVAVLDLSSASLGGAEFFSLVRSHEYTLRLPGIPVIAAADAFEATERARALADGFVACAAVPVIADTLKDGIERVRRFRPMLHVNRRSDDHERILHCLRELMDAEGKTGNAGQIASGWAVAAQGGAKEALHECLLAAYRGEVAASLEFAGMLDSLARELGAQHLCLLAQELGRLAGEGDSSPVEAAVVLARAELDRVVYSIREEVRHGRKRGSGDLPERSP
jgi:CheY-like chemotaxis protein